jgi:CheY-like chemotaxis protein
MVNGKGRSGASLIEHLLKAKRKRGNSIKPAQAQAGEGQPRARSEPERAPRVLVVDDSDTARGMMCSTLERAGYEVLELPSAIGATRIIQQNSVSVVVVDVNMPGLSGDSLVEVLRMHPRFRDLIIVVVSAQPASDLEALRAQCGADGALIKSDIKAELVGVVGRLLQNSPARASSHFGK